MLHNRDQYKTKRKFASGRVEPVEVPSAHETHARSRLTPHVLPTQLNAYGIMEQGTSFWASNPLEELYTRKGGLKEEMRFIRRGDYHRYDLLSEEEPEEAPDGRVRTDEGGQVLRCCADCGAPFFRFPDG